MNNLFQIKKLKIQWYNSSDFCPLKDIFPPFGVISPFRRLPPQDFFPHLGVIPSFRSSFPLLPLFTEKNFASWMETFLRLLFEMIYIKAVADLAHLMKSNREPLSIYSRSFSLAKNNCPPPPSNLVYFRRPPHLKNKTTPFTAHSLLIPDSRIFVKISMLKVEWLRFAVQQDRSMQTIFSYICPFSTSSYKK